MEYYSILNIVCAIAGMLIFIYCIQIVSKILLHFPNAKMNKSWKVIRILIAFFLIGYILNILAVLLELNEVLLIMQALVYLFGALFVFIVVRLSYKTYQLLKQSAEE
jgi:hypothetical protein